VVKSPKVIVILLFLSDMSKCKLYIIKKRRFPLKIKAVANISYMLCSLRFTQHIPLALYTIWPALLFSGALNQGHNIGSSHQLKKLFKTVRFDQRIQLAPSIRWLSFEQRLLKANQTVYNISYMHSAGCQ